MRSNSDRRRALLGLAGVTLLAGCSAHAAGREGAGAEPSEAEPARPDLSFLAGKSLRVVPKGSVMTMDYREDRLTILLDEDERIERAYVG